jgi:hypothetical protein
MAGLISFEYKKMNGNKLKSAVSDAVEGVLSGVGGIAAPAVAAVARTGVTALQAEIDDLLAQVTINAGPVDAATVTQYLNQFPGVPAANIKFVQDHPEILAKLKARNRRGEAVFSQEQQAKILADIDWLQTLLSIAPLLLKILLMFI